MAENAYVRLWVARGHIAELVAALEFYARDTNYAVTQLREPRSVVHQDQGQRARDALAFIGRETT